ncbi:3'-5' exonuclease [Prochlorococcus sp. MIT 1307]|uniref:3'-5' exonuclease n=1 Tax=Prochlorococcus sp. MIT 1307 TaxID=3096219 RepID=UPI002A75FD17|nr:3'-5' exonuclease [Prochlorococcus sp. MIT 1307]
MSFARDDPSTSFPKMLLIIDTETTGLDPQTDECIEVGAILFHVLSRSVIAQHSFLLPVASNSAEPINRISAEVSRLEQPWQQAVLYFQNLIDVADVLVAHNTNFDREWFGKGPLPAISKPWLCTMNDIRWPSERQLRARPSVRDLALAYEVPVWNAHRALTDCLYIAEVFRRCDDLEVLLAHGLEPRKLMRAQVSFEQRYLAKKAGFTWNEPVRGAWTRRLSEREELLLDFAVTPIESID